MPVHLRRELLERGYDDKTLRKAIRDGVFARIRRGALADARQLAELDAMALHAVRARAVARQAKSPVVISHASALSFIPDMPTWGLDLTDVHVTRKDGRAGRHEAGVRQHRGLVLPDDVMQIGDVEVMAPHRSALEITMMNNVEAALIAVNFLLHSKLVSKEQLIERYKNGIGQWPHSLTTELVLRLADPRIESVGETRCDYLFFRNGLLRPQPQFEIYDERGVLVARLDFAWPEKRVWVEFDGRIKYQKLLRDGESVTDVVLKEKARQELVERLTGWRCIRVTWDDLRDPQRLIAKILAAFAEMAA